MTTKTVSLRNVSGEPLHLGSADGRIVDVDEVIHVEGELAPKKDQPDDAIVVGTGDDARSYPASVWKQVGTAKTVDADVTAPGKENV